MFIEGVSIDDPGGCRNLPVQLWILVRQSDPLLREREAGVLDEEPQVGMACKYLFE